jgi:hypothetical protein
LQFSFSTAAVPDQSAHDEDDAANGVGATLAAGQRLGSPSLKIDHISGRAGTHDKSD